MKIRFGFRAHSGLATTLAALSLLWGVLSAHAALHVADLRCEYVTNPLGSDAAAPRLAWTLTSNQRGQRQTAFQIVVATKPGALHPGQADLWDSGRVASSETAQIVYQGKVLNSRQQCFWSVRAWDQEGRPSAWSAPASWEMGLLAGSDWQAQWIGRTPDAEQRPAPMFRRGFTLDGKIKRARVYLCGLGYYELHLNGQKVGDHLLDPGYTRYDRRVLYVTYDVTPLLKKGDNALGVILGNGWFNVQTKAVWNFHRAPWRAAPRLLCQLEIEFVDGRKTVIASGPDWKCATGPIRFDSIYGGETYDARLEQPGWDRPGYDDGAWQPVEVVDPPQGKLAAQMMPPIQADAVLLPGKITEPRPGVFVVDFAQNLAGHVELRVRGDAGTKIVLRYGERLFPDGTLDTGDIAQHVLRADTNQQFQADTYLLKGGGPETWQSRFTYHGFQYIEVTGFPGRPTRDNFRAVFTHSAVPVAGEFACSNPLLNRIWLAGRWSYLSNLQGIPTDCPHREKNGWTGDAHLAAEQALFNFFPAAVYTKWINDLTDEQRPSGELPGIVPTSGWGYAWGNGPAWDSALLLIPSYLHEYYGDTRVLTAHYESLKRYVDYLTTKAKDGIVSIGLNDWAPFRTQTPADITSTAYYYRDAQIVALAASLLGKADDAQRYTGLAADIRRAFNAKFFNPATGLYANGSQTALSCALYQGLVEPEQKERVLSNLVAAVERQNGHIDTGILGAKYLLNTLLDNGRADVAYRIVSQKDLPSWGWWIEQGATTLWEQWNGTESRNHIMFGDVSAWFYKALAGIRPDPAAPGFAHFFVAPQVVGDLTFARADYDSIRGKIVSDWKVVNGEFRLAVEVPANTTATVSVPIASLDQVRESGRPAAKARGVRFLRVENGRTVFEVGSGNYRFAGPLAR